MGNPQHRVHQRKKRTIITHDSLTENVLFDRLTGANWNTNSDNADDELKRILHSMRQCGERTEKSFSFNDSRHLFDTIRDARTQHQLLRQWFLCVSIWNGLRYRRSHHQNRKLWKWKMYELMRRQMYNECMNDKRKKKQQKNQKKTRKELKKI